MYTKHGSKEKSQYFQLHLSNKQKLKPYTGDNSRNG
jgi:ribosomal protein S4